MQESGTQFEQQDSRPNSSAGHVIVPGKYVSADRPRAKSTEPRLGTRASAMSGGGSEKSMVRKSGGISPHAGERPHGETPDREKELQSPSGTRFPSLQPKSSAAEGPTPFLLPLQRVYAPNLLINHCKAMRSSVRIHPTGSSDDSVINKTRTSMNHSATIEEGIRSKSQSSISIPMMRSQSPAQRQPSPSIFGAPKGAAARPAPPGTKSGIPRKESKVSKSQDAGKSAKPPVEDIDVFMPSSKELKEAKELFRQFDTDGDGTLTMSEIQASLYFNNVDYEEIQAIFGPNGIKGLGPNGTVSVEEFASFLCRRRRENANRQQSSHVSKHSRVARLYVSSCLHQHFEERKILHEVVFPQFAALCESLGGEFIPVDLRYHEGDASTIGAGPGQAEAMGELARVATEKNYLFLGLIADLPGECVLPSEVSNAEFETLKACAHIFEAASDEKGLPQALDNLYLLDANAITPTYVLRPGSEQEMSAVLKAFSEHEGEEKQAHSSFGRVRAKIAKSLNEQEVTKCLSQGSELDQARRTLLCVRSVEDMPLDKMLNVLVGKTEDEILQAVDRQTIFRENIVERVAPANVFKYTIPYSPDVVHITEPQGPSQKAPVEVKSHDYLERFAGDVYRALSGRLVEMLSRPAASGLDMELEAQVALMKRSAAAVFRADADPLVREVLEYMHGSPQRAALLERASAGPDAKTRKRAKEEAERMPLADSPLVVTAGPGMGKTALLAHVAEKFSYSKEAGQYALVYRCVGATALSSDGRLLLDGLCEELARLVGAPRSGPRPPSYNKLLVELGEQLRALSNKKPLVLFLDGLDRLPDTDHARRLSWLPVTLPPNVFVVASSLPGQPQAISRYPKQNLREIKPLDPVEFRPLVNHWLENYKQNLQEPQKEDVVKTAAAWAAVAPAVGMRAHLRLAFDEATNGVASFAAPDKLGDMATAAGVLVFECLGLLLASDGGLLETELRGLLRLEEACRETGASPLLRYHRMLHRLAPYTTTRERDGGHVLAVRHDSYRQIILGSEPFAARLPHWSRQLAEFYAAQPRALVAESGRVTMNVRKLRYLVYYQLAAEMWAEACRTLCSIATMQALCEAGMSVELQRMFATALRAIPPDFQDEADEAAGMRTVQVFFRFLIRTVHALSQHSRMIEQPGLVIQMAANEPQDTLPERQAQQVLAAEGEARVWMQAVNKPAGVSPLFTTLVGAQDPVRASHVSSDGALIATGGGGGEVLIWDAETGESVTALSGHAGPVHAVVFAPSGSTLVSGSADGTAKVWDEPNAACVCTYRGHSAAVLGVAVSPSGEVVASCCQEATVQLWKLADAAGLRVLKGHTAAVRAVAFSADGALLGSASLDKTARVWEVKSGKQRQELEHRGKVYDVHFTQDSARLVSASAFATCSLWDLGASGGGAEPVREFKTGSGACFSCSLINGDAALCMASEHGAVFLWDLDDAARPSLELAAHTEMVHRTSVSGDGAWLVTSGEDKVTKVWSLKTVEANMRVERARRTEAVGPEAEAEAGEREHAMLSMSQDEAEGAGEPEDSDMPDIVRSIALSADGAFGVSCSEHGSLQVWDVNTAELLLRCRSPAVARVVRFHPQQPETFVCGCDDGFIRVFDIGEMRGSGSAVCSKEIGYHELCIRSLRWCRDGVRFVTGSIDATARLWSLHSLSQELTLVGHKDSVLDADMSSSLLLLVTASTDKTVRVWNARTGKEQWVGKHGAYVYACTFSPDCRRAISASGDRTARVWAAKKGECLHILKAASAMLTCAVSEHANVLMASGYEGALHFWDTKAFEAPAVDGEGHGAEVRCAEFSKYGSFAVTASNDGSVRVFDTRSGASLGALPLPHAVYAMAALVDDSRALCMCGDEFGNVNVVHISGVRDTPPGPDNIADSPPRRLHPARQVPEAART